MDKRELDMYKLEDAIKALLEGMYFFIHNI